MPHPSRPLCYAITIPTSASRTPRRNYFAAVRWPVLLCCTTTSTPMASFTTRVKSRFVISKPMESYCGIVKTSAFKLLRPSVSFLLFDGHADYSLHQGVAQCRSAPENFVGFYPILLTALQRFDDSREGCQIVWVIPLICNVWELLRQLLLTRARDCVYSEGMMSFIQT